MPRAEVLPLLTIQLTDQTGERARRGHDVEDHERLVRSLVELHRTGWMGPVAPREVELMVTRLPLQNVLDRAAAYTGVSALGPVFRVGSSRCP